MGVVVAVSGIEVVVIVVVVGVAVDVVVVGGAVVVEDMVLEVGVVELVSDGPEDPHAAASSTREQIAIDRRTGVITWASVPRRRCCAFTGVTMTWSPGGDQSPVTPDAAF
jgi:hypothetical protein